jgi:hypothetical protein
LKYKSDVFTIFKKFKDTIENESGQHIKVLRRIEEVSMNHMHFFVLAIIVVFKDKLVLPKHHRKMG